MKQILIVLAIVAMALTGQAQERPNQPASAGTGLTLGTPNQSVSQSPAFLGGISDVGSPSRMGAGNAFDTPQQPLWYYGGKASEATAAHNTTDYGPTLISMNGFARCTLNFALVSTNAGAWVSGPILTNTDGVVFGIEDYLAGSIGIENASGITNNGQRLFQIVNNNRDFALNSSRTVGTIAGNYNWLYCDSTNHHVFIPQWKAGCFMYYMTNVIGGSYVKAFDVNCDDGSINMLGPLTLAGGGLTVNGSAGFLSIGENAFFGGAHTTGFQQFSGGNKIAWDNVSNNFSATLTMVGGDTTNNVVFSGRGVNIQRGGLAERVDSTATGVTMDWGTGNLLVTATGQTITLPAVASVPNRIYTIKLTASGSCTVNGGGVNIDGASTYSLSAQYKYVTVQNNGTQWWIIANN